MVQVSQAREATWKHCRLELCWAETQRPAQPARCHGVLGARPLAQGPEDLRVYAPAVRGMNEFGAPRADVAAQDAARGDETLRSVLAHAASAAGCGALSHGAPWPASKL